MSHIHFLLNTKGGTGKSLFSYILAQYLIGKGIKTTCIDCDPVTPTLINYKALDAQYLRIMKENNIDPLNFDKLIESFTKGEENEHFVIDNGTSSFVALSAYLKTDHAVPILREIGHTITFHVIIVGGDNMIGTLEGFEYIVNNFKDDAQIVVWLNPFFGPITDENKTFEQFNVFTKNAQSVSAILQYPDFPKDTYGKSFALLQKDRLTFAEVCDVESAPSQYNFMTLQRLNTMRKQIFAMLDAARVI